MTDGTDVAGDVQALAALKREAEADPRTIPEMKAEDYTWTEGEIVRVSKGDRHWSVEWRELREVTKDGEVVDCTHQSQVGIGMPITEGMTEPKEGDTFRCYGRFGQEVHGMDLNGEEVYWLTPWERFAKRMQMLADYDRKDRERFAEAKEQMDARYDALCPAMKARIDRFRRESPTFRMSSEAYEMAAVVDAEKIAKALAAEQGWEVDENFTAKAEDDEVIKAVVEEFRDATNEEQYKRVPDLDRGHSGNTWGHAVHFAYGLLSGSIPQHEAEAAGTPS